MRIIVVGCGKIGGTLASQLVAEGHDVTVIDNNREVLNSLTNTLDVIAYHGNGGSYLALKEAGAQYAELLIAATESDEINMLCCLTAHKLGTVHTVARIRDPEYYSQVVFLKEELGLSMAINPDQAAAQEIARVLRFPSAINAEVFAKGRAEMVSFRVSEDSPVTGCALKDLPAKLGCRMLICAVERQDEVFVPDGNFCIRTGDRAFMTAGAGEMSKALKKLGMMKERVRDVLVAGGGRTTYYLAEEITHAGMRVKIVERDAERARELAELLPGCTVLLGSMDDHELLLEEGLADADAYVALSGLDEGNILSAMYAAEAGAGKVIAKVNNGNLVALIRDDRLESIITPKEITANRIVAYVRAMNASREDGNVESLYRIVGGKAEMLEFRAGAEGSYLNVPLKDLSMKKGTLIACIIREGKAVIPSGTDSIHPGDGVLLVTKGHHIGSLQEMLAE